MAIDLTEPMLKIEHDHTRLDMMLEDLEAVARQGLTAQDHDLLEDARTTWGHLYAEVARHFTCEERKIFNVLTAIYADLKEPLEGLTREHDVLRSAMTRIGQMLEGTVEEVSSRKNGFDEVWKDLARLWSHHAGIEWDLFQEIHRRIGRSTEDETAGSSQEKPVGPDVT